MKPKSRLLRFLSVTGSSLLAAASAFVSLPNANAAEYWWNQNGTTDGWGAGGTWEGASFSATNSDTASAGTAATTSSDTLNFGTSTVGFAGGSITGNGGIRDIGTIVTGSANTGDITLTNIRLRFNNPGTITNNSLSVLNFAGVFEGSATRLDLNANGGNIQLIGVASTAFTGIIYINTGTVLSNANVFGQTGSDSNRTVIASGARLLFNNSINYSERFEIAGAGVGGTSGAFVNSGNRSTTLSGQVTLSGNATTYSDSSSNALTFGGGIVLGANALTFNSVNAGSIQTVQTNAISGTNGSVVKAGSGILNLNVASSYTGGTTLSAGTINIGAAISGSDSPLGSTSGQLTVNGGTLNMAGNNVTVGNLTGAGGVISGSSGTRTLTIGEGDTGGGNYQGQINNGTGGTTALIKTGTGTITLSGTNNYSGGTTISVGMLALGHPTNTLANTGAINVNGGELSIGGNSDTVGAVTLTIGSITGTGGTLTGSSYAVESGSVSAILGGSGALTKSTAGTVTLTGANYYAGATSVDAGTLSLGVDACLADTSNVVIGAGTLAAGTDVNDSVGTLDVTGAATINLASGATLSFADSSAGGTATWAGTLNLIGFVTGSSLNFGSSTGLTAQQLGKISATGFSNFSLDAEGDLIADNTGGPGPLDHFAISAIGSPQTVGTPITGITLTAQDSSNQTVTSFTGTVDFSGSGGFSGTSASFTAGVLNGVSVTPANAGGNLTLVVTDLVSTKTGSQTITTIQTQYQAWSLGAPFDGDLNGDGVSNGLAFLLGASGPNVSALDKLPTVSQSGGNLTLSFSARNLASRGNATLSVQHSQDLGIGDPWATVAVPDTEGASGPTSGVTFNVTLGDPLNTVTATVSSTETATGKLFGRVKGTNP